jgi:hypothetical protein
MMKQILFVSYWYIHVLLGSFSQVEFFELSKQPCRLHSFVRLLAADRLIMFMAPVLIGLESVKTGLSVVVS